MEFEAVNPRTGQYFSSFFTCSSKVKTGTSAGVIVFEPGLRR
jgi:hypothetical protein